MPEINRFGFVVNQKSAKKFYAIWEWMRKSRMKVSMTKVFEYMIDLAFASMPDEFQNLDQINISKEEKVDG
jgi:hypothetical protein